MRTALSCSTNLHSPSNTWSILPSLAFAYLHPELPSWSTTGPYHHFVLLQHLPSWWMHSRHHDWSMTDTSMIDPHPSVAIIGHWSSWDLICTILYSSSTASHITVRILGWTPIDTISLISIMIYNLCLVTSTCLLFVMDPHHQSTIPQSG